MAVTLADKPENEAPLEDVPEMLPEVDSAVISESEAAAAAITAKAAAAAAANAAAAKAALERKFTIYISNFYFFQLI